MEMQSHIYGFEPISPAKSHLWFGSKHRRGFNFLLGNREVQEDLGPRCQKSPEGNEASPVSSQIPSTPEEKRKTLSPQPQLESFADDTQ